MDARGKKYGLLVVLVDIDPTERILPQTDEAPYARLARLPMP